MSNEKRDHYLEYQSSKKDIIGKLKAQDEFLESYRSSLKIYSLQVSGLQAQVSELQVYASSLEKEIENKNAIIHKMKTPIFFKMIGYFKRNIALNNVIKKYSPIIKIKRLLEIYPPKIVIKRLVEIYQIEGVRGVYSKLLFRLSCLLTRSRNKQFIVNNFHFTADNKNVSSKNIFMDKLSLIYKNEFPKTVSSENYTLILIVAEVTLPQCYKYRVQQKAEHLERLGWDVKIVDWRDQKDVLSFLQVCKEVIFYRVPAFPNVVEQITEAKRLGLSPWWEVDDLIIDEERYAECGFMEFLSKEEKDLLFFGTDLYRKTMFSFDRAIASTKALADVMHKAGISNVCVIENALDKDTLRIAHKINKEKNNQSKKVKQPVIDKKRGEVVIVYGSGTNTHNADFLVAANGIFSAMKKEPNLHLWVIGELEIPNEFQSITKQVRYIPPKPYEEYLEFLALADIAIAPLEPILFNDAKSNIKYLEASILKVPSVCSPRQAFREVIKDQKNGMLANTLDEWEEKLLILARDAKLRKSMGQQAYQDVVAHYSPENITDKQVEPIFGKRSSGSTNKEKLKVLVVNVYYDPYSFGGATLVAEEMVQQIQKNNDDVEVSIFTTRPFKDTQRGLCKYQSNGSVVYSIDLEPTPHATHQFDNLAIIESFDMVLKAVKPDVVHFHSIQNMGLQMLLGCQGKNIPYVITLHDSWWLCNRQFMVRSNGEYCFQKKIDLKVCQPCEEHARHLAERMVMMKQGLRAASLLFSPSETHKRLYVANDIDESLIKVNRNGIIRPKKTRPPRPKNTPLRFGFTAGDEVIKGAVVIQKAFRSLSRSDWELKIIDSKVNMGFSPIDVNSWNAKGKVITIPPYDNDSKDDFFYGIDVLLFPSQCKESYGLTVREALLRDVWVICSHPGGQSEDLIDGENGSYVSLKGDVKELKEVIENLLDNASMFDHYENPHKEKIATVEGQAEELLKYYYQIKEDNQAIVLS